MATIQTIQKEKKKKRPVIFWSKYPNYQIVLEPRRDVYAPDGRRKTTTGTTVVFVNHYYKTEDENIIEKLRKLPQCDTSELTETR